MNKEIFKHICCPNCHSNIETSKDHYHCSKCQSDYPIVDGIADFTIEVGEDWVDNISQKNILFYDSTAQRYEDNFTSPPKAIASILKSLIEKETPINPYARKRVSEIIFRYYDREGLFLEMGCGTGHLLQLLGANNNRALGIDISRQMLKDANKRNLNCIRANNYRTPFRDNTFNMIAAFSAVHHMADLEMFFKEAFRILKTGGILYTDSDPNPIALAIKEKCKIYKKSSEFIRNILRRDFYNLFESTGIKMEDVDYHQHRAGQSGYNIDNLKSIWAGVGFEKLGIYFHSNAASIFRKSLFNEKAIHTLRKHLLHLFNPGIKIDLCSECLLAILRKPIHNNSSDT